MKCPDCLIPLDDDTISDQERCKTCRGCFDEDINLNNQLIEYAQEVYLRFLYTKPELADECVEAIEKLQRTNNELKKRVTRRKVSKTLPKITWI